MYFLFNFLKKRMNSLKNIGVSLIYLTIRISELHTSFCKTFKRKCYDNL